MIVDSMTYSEIIKVNEKYTIRLVKEINDGLKFYSKDVSKNLFRREKHYYKPKEYSVPEGLHYVIQFFDGGKAYNTKERTRFFYYCWFLKDRGLYAMNSSRMNRQFKHYNIFTPHFIDRYKERYLQDNTISKKEAILTFLRGNTKLSSCAFPSEKYPDCVWEAGNQGLCLCNLLDNFTIEMKTFVSYDMLGFDQKTFAVQSQDFMMKNGLELKLPEEDFKDFTIEEE